MPIANQVDRRFYVQQAEVVLAQANPISGTIYALLPLTTYVRVLDVTVWVTWTVQPTPLELHGTLDGIPIIWTFTNPVNVTPYRPIYDSAAGAAAYPLVITTMAGRPFVMENTAILLSCETTGGTVQALDGRIAYQRYI